MFSLINALIVRPIVNILFVIYNLVGDFGLAIIIFVVIVKLATWPLIKKQMHQTRIMRQIQPELAEIKKRCNGNRQMESLQMMELYKRKNVKPFRSVATIFIQLPIFIALFTAINVTVRPCEVSDDYKAPVASTRCAGAKEGKTIKYNVIHSAYPFVANMSRINDIIEMQRNYLTAYSENPEAANYEFEPKLFGKLNLSVKATDFFSDIKENGFTKHSLHSVVIFIFAICSAVAQFIMAKMNDPSRKTGKKKKGFRELMKETAKGNEVSQEDINAMAQQQSTLMMPFMMLFIMVSLPGALVFYYLLNNTITIGLNKFLMNRNLTEMEESADKKIIKELKAHEAVEAEIVKGVEKNIRDAKKEANGHYGNKNKNKDSDGGVHITRITASDKKKRRK
jgi:YidC/Oxa1 family membrane protein insertase